MIILHCLLLLKTLYWNFHFENLVSVCNQLVVIATTSETIDLRGQFQEHNGSILFVGSPWFVSMNQVTEKELTLHDFAFHDPLLDLPMC
jgi:hypothetical protein